jgi:FkbM family methyltransferase
VNFSNLRTLIGFRRAFGFWATVRAVVSRFLLGGRPLQVWWSGAATRHRIRIRPRDSDIFVASQVLGWLEYELDPARTAALNALAEDWNRTGAVPVIVDAGANIGLSALFFASTFPGATVIAVEPGAATFDVLVENVRSQPRVIPLRAALWSSDGGVELETSDSGSWGTRTVEAAGPNLVPSATMDQVLASVPNARLLLAKIDIEGAEREALSVGASALPDAPVVMIESHDWMLPGHGSLVPLLAAKAGREVDVLVNGENLVFVDSTLGAPKAVGI